MTLLLDTHALLWWLADELTAEVRDRVADPAVSVFVSAASVWEIGVKRAIGKLEIEGSVVDEVSASGFTALPIDLRHPDTAGALPLHHRDPFDRMIIAQAMVERLVIVTRDRAFDAYEVRTLAC